MRVVAGRVYLVAAVACLGHLFATSRRLYSTSDVTAASCGDGSGKSNNDRSRRGPLTNSSLRHRYPEFKDEEPDPSALAAASLNLTNRVIHVGKFGLGHRLGRMGSAWHLAKSLNLTRLEPVWDDCSGVPNAFAELFGGAFVDVPGSARRALEANATGDVGKAIKATNDVSGYYGGANYKWHRVPLSARKYKGVGSPWLEKLDSDAELFRILRKRFVGKDDAMRFMEEHGFRERLVVGLHLRLGNDEPLHFADSGRRVDDQLEFVYNMLDLLHSFLDELRLSHPERFMVETLPEGCRKQKEPLIFLATDSPRFIRPIANEFDTVVVEQARVNAGVGVTFHVLKEGEKCLQGWRDMVLDAVLLSAVDVLVSPRYSSFAQILPLPLVFERGEGGRGPRFCEMSDAARTMTCVEDRRTWLFRNDAHRVFAYSASGENMTGEPPVVHRLLPHLPDLVTSEEHLWATEFLSSNDRLRNGTSLLPLPAEMVEMKYGHRFDPKYRNGISCPNCTDFLFT